MDAPFNAEGLALLIVLVLQLVIGTIANLWRVFVIRDFDRYVLLRAVVGSAILIGAFALAMNTPTSS